MFTFLIVIIIVSFALILGLFVYQHRRIIKKGHVTLHHENRIKEDPLSIHNIHSTKKVLQEHTKEHGRKIYLFLLKATIKIKKSSKGLLDKLIIKLAKLAFPENKHSIELTENLVLKKAEDHKKNGERGSIE